MRTRMIVAAALLTVSSSCSGDVISALPEEPPLPTPTPLCPAASAAAGDGDARVESVDAVRIQGFERMEFRLNPEAGGAPAYELVSVRPPFGIEGTGRTVEVEGRHYTRVIIHEPQATPPAGDGRVVTPDNVLERRNVIADVEFVPGPGAASSWVVGLRKPACPQASFVLDPPTFVVDFRLVSRR